MKSKIFITLAVFQLLFCISCVSQDKATSKLVGNCEGCEAIFEHKDHSLPIANRDTLPEFNKEGTPIKITGTIYKAGGKEPAEGVILYVYHTNQEGVYPVTGNEKGWARRHGYIRGWMKTGSDGRYTFYTLKPGTYPSRSESAHIHPTVLEPGGKYYWLDSYLFDDDPLLTEKDRSQESPRGGSSGIITLKKEGDLWTGTRDIELGKNIDGYE